MVGGEDVGGRGGGRGGGGGSYGCSRGGRGAPAVSISRWYMRRPFGAHRSLRRAADADQRSRFLWNFPPFMIATNDFSGVSNSPRSFNGLPSITSRSANAPGRRQPSLPC